ncbi:ABC transporter permease [Actinomyces sp. MRS3W]|uniref:ABC transporter permease n=1 Tax=Actinomyces sp. MRS3W TaxID=2800796 RepID=UPI0028FD284E|nr:ABC transporter permease [Actinomyces sp. MRS3W]MDU0349799.1 ABC transporter permease [Actinomyces sp. MRS3W]
MRTAIVFILVLAQAACVFTGLMLIQNLRRELTLAEQRLGADVLVYPTAGINQLYQDQLLMQGTPVEYYRPRSTLSRMQTNDDIESVTYQLYLADTTPDGERLWIVGFDPATDFVISPWLAEGSDYVLGDGVVAVGSRVEVSAADTVELFGRERRVSAHLLGTGSEMDHAVFVTLSTLDELIDDSVAAGIDTYASVEAGRDYSVALLRLKDKDDVESVTAWINIYVRRVTAVGSDAALTTTATDIRTHLWLLIAIAGGTWLILLAALAIAQSLLMHERRQEFRVWLTVGASRRTINRVMAHEAALVHAAGGLAGVVLATLVLGCVGDGTGVGALATPARLLPAAAVTLLVSLVVGWASTWLAVKGETCSR